MLAQPGLAPRGHSSAPRRTVRAFLRGRRGENLYGRPFEALLDRTVGELRREDARRLTFFQPSGARRALARAPRASRGSPLTVLGLAVALVVAPIGIVNLALCAAAAARLAWRRELRGIRPVPPAKTLPLRLRQPPPDGVPRAPAPSGTAEGIHAQLKIALAERGLAKMKARAFPRAASTSAGRARSSPSSRTATSTGA